MTASRRKALSSSSSNNGENKNNNLSLNRKASKPLMEKRRRARINESLTELKKIVVVNGSEKNGNSTKLEKADILEMTVKYLRELCKSQRGYTWRDGFDDCLERTSKFLKDSGHSDLSNEISLHLQTNCIEEPNQISSSEIEPINLAIYNGMGREEMFVWRPW